MAPKAKAKKTIETLLTEAGFQTLEKPNKRIIHASGTADFGKSHAAFLKSACNPKAFGGAGHPAFIGASPFGTGRDLVLIIHRHPPATSTCPAKPRRSGNEQPATEEQRDS